MVDPSEYPRYCKVSLLEKNMVGILIATHGSIGHALLETAIDLVGESISCVSAVTIDDTMDRAQAWDSLVAGYDSVNGGDGVLIMVDMFGSTSSTLALSLLAEREVEVLTGVNLAMVLRALIHRDQKKLDALAEDVLRYGQRNVTSSSTWLSVTPAKGNESE
jgi:mannose/fructose-specific phosphotransferase system component IIA